MYSKSKLIGWTYKSVLQLMNIVEDVAKKYMDSIVAAPKPWRSSTKRLRSVKQSCLRKEDGNFGISTTLKIQTNAKIPI